MGTNLNYLDMFIKAYVVGTHSNFLDLSSRGKSDEYLQHNAVIKK